MRPEKIRVTPTPPPPEKGSQINVFRCKVTDIVYQGTYTKYWLLSKSGELLGLPYMYRDARTQGLLAEALKTVSRNEIFTARLSRVAGEKPVIGNEATMQQILQKLDGATYNVANIETKEVRRRPFPPFITSSLQQEASRKLGFSPRKTMILAQQLYEGIALGAEGTDGLLT